MSSSSFPAPWLLPRPLRLRAAKSNADEGAGSGVVVADLAEPHGPAMLTVRRTAAEDAQNRQVYISLDGQDWGTLYYGNQLACEIAPGRHAVKANNTLVRHTVEFDVKPGEHVRFQCINKTHWTGMLFMAFLGAAVLTVKLVREPNGA
ncbi:MAG: hypothetical protein ABI880_06655 [Acidobacteriota bacterium]